MGLVAVVNMTYVRTRYGAFEAGNLFVFPWLKPAGVALGSTKVWGSVIPVNLTQAISAEPIRGTALPVDDYFCNFILRVPTQFIGCIVDLPYSPVETRFAWFDNTKLGDGLSVGIDWTSSNLNNPWFGGSRTIPDTSECNGAQWRKLIIDGLYRTAVAAC
jgi:hypothetical protein